MSRPLGAGLRVAVALAIVAETIALGVVPASAEPPFVGGCGRVTAVTAPTATAFGTITIGSVVYPIRATDAVETTNVVGTLRCIRRAVTTSGPVLELFGMPSTACGTVVSPIYSRGLVLALGGRSDMQLFFEIAGGMTYPAAAVTGFSGCFTLVLDQAGNARIASVIPATTTPATAPPAAPSGRGSVRTLPNTSTSD
jgi:hypothetical protein